MISPSFTPLSAKVSTRQALGLAAVFVNVFGTLPTSARAQAPEASPASGYHLDATWKLGGEGGWDYLTVDPQAHRLYVTRPNRVQVIDTEKGTTVGEVTGLDGGHGTALAPEFNRGFATSGKNGKVVVFDLKTLQPIGEPVAVGKKPDAIIYEPLTKHVFSFNGESNDATVIDAATAKVVATIPLGGGPEFAVADGIGTLFVNLEDKNETLAIDVRTNTVTHRWPLAPGEAPTGLAFDPAGHRLYAGCHNERMIVLDAGSGKVIGTLPIGKGVDACAFDPATGFAFASCGDGTLTVVKEEPKGGIPCGRASDDPPGCPHDGARSADPRGVPGRCRLRSRAHPCARCATHATENGPRQLRCPQIRPLRAARDPILEDHRRSDAFTARGLPTATSPGSESTCVLGRSRSRW